MQKTFSILIIASRFPEIVGPGDSMTIYHMIDYFYKKGHKIYLVTFLKDMKLKTGKFENIYQKLAGKCEFISVVKLSLIKSIIQALFGIISKKPSQILYFKYRRMQKVVDTIISVRNPDILYAHNIRNAQYLLKYKEKLTVSGLMISYALNYQRMYIYLRNPILKVFYWIEYMKIKSYEANIINQFSRVLLISKKDKEVIIRKDMGENVFINPHGLDIDYFSNFKKTLKQNNSLILSGDFSYHPNIDAALYFYHKIFPKIKEIIPDVELWLVGRDPVKRIRKLAKDNSVVVTGWVKDIREYLNKAEIAIVPIRIAAGMQNKLIIAMASRLPVVATSAANEGIKSQDDKELLIADNPDDFSKKVISLIANKNKQQKLIEHAFNFTSEKWTWSYHFKKLEEMLHKAIENKNDKIIQYFN